ncbi:hypothetical protein [Paracraurococcus lichenis]|uniref:Uncharacterized protein n=1 Tax=Paracraurococcus lichenis TaxID=3064888 RepID=A0ABT9E0Y4_9PROT|nr:hypothetical protein [Paracraurococcus sp. LOR1-02]MDO9709825.1 hypothetical protein [Paracraurococcus sp. LOR1-02]
MIRNALIASAIALGTIGAAQAQDAAPRLVGGGADASVVYDAPSRNLAGGGLATILGGGENQRLSYAGITTQAPSGLVGTVIGGGENRQLVYRPALAGSRLLAGQGARQGS